MKVYRDCINGSPNAPFEGYPNPSGAIIPAHFTVYDVNGTVVLFSQFTPISKNNVPPTVNSPCAPATLGVACVEEAIYETTVNLPPIVGGYYIAYQRCCRNGTILNLVNPGNVGATYWEHIPGSEVVAVNSSPRFTNRPPIYICQGLSIKFPHQATDPDGDSLVYSLGTPFDGLSTCCPVIGGGGCNGSCPTVNTPPSYSPVPFIPPYSAANPMAANPVVSINPQTGLLNGKPTILGQWVIGIYVKEYRHGILIGTHYRDFQFNVITCPLLGEADVKPEQTSNNGTGTGYCNGYKLSFINTSTGNNFLGAFWDFGDPNSTTDTTSLPNPIYTYNTIGIYTVTIIINRNTACPDTQRREFHVYPLLDPSIIQPTAQCVTNNSYEFNATGGFLGTGTFAWMFGLQATPSSAITHSVSNVHFNSAGIFPVSFTVTENDCVASTTTTVEVIQNTKAQLGSFAGVGCDPYNLTFPNISGGASLNYFWQFSDGGTSTDATPTHVFTPPGIYSLSLTAISNNVCKDTSKLSAVNSITVNPSPVAGFIGTPTITTIFDPDIAFINTTVSEGIVRWYYAFGDGQGSSDVNPFHTYTTWNDFEVTQTVVNGYGCPNTARLLIRILPEFRFWVPNAFTPWNKDGLNDLFKPKVIGVEEYLFTIFDRWGTQVYKTNDPEQGWNGTFKHEDCTDDVYVWKCDFKNIVSKEHEYHVGHVMLVR